MKFTVLHYPQLDSTNNLAKEFAILGVGTGTVVLADYQSKGRGRFKRKWVSPRGKDLLFSIIIRPKHLKAGSASILTQITARAVLDSLKEAFAIQATIKRPNDLLVDGKKICGILVESSTHQNEIEYMVVGIGLNVNSKTKDLVRGATSIWELTGHFSDKSNLLQTVLSHFSHKTKEIGWSYD